MPNTKPSTETLPAVPVDNNVDLLAHLKATEDEWADVGETDLDPDDNRIPLIKMSMKADNTGGIQLGGDKVDRIDFVWAAKSSSRVLFQGKYNATQKPVVLCRASDGKTPDATVAEPVSAKCAGCPQSWEAGGDCKKSLEGMVYLPDAGVIRVAKLRFSGRGYTAAKHYWDSFQYRLPKKPALSVITTMTLVDTPSDYGTSYVPHFEVARDLTRAEAQVFIADKKTRLAEWQEGIEEDLAGGVINEDLERDTSHDPFPDDETGETLPPEAYGDDEIIELTPEDTEDLDDTIRRYGDRPDLLTNLPPEP